MPKQIKTQVKNTTIVGAILLVAVIGLSFFIAQMYSVGVKFKQLNDSPKGCKSHNDFALYFSFDDSTISGNSVSDSSGSGIAAVALEGLSGSSTPNYAIKTVQGVKGQAMEFDGNDYLITSLNYCGSQHNIKQLTVCTWFKSTATSDDKFGNWAFIDFDRSEYFTFFLNEDTGQLGFSTHAKNGVHDLYSDVDMLYTPEWHFGCAIYDHGKKYFYIDGQIDYGEGNTSVKKYHNGKPLKSSNTRYGVIGDGSETENYMVDKRNNTFYEGYLDELRIYEKVLSEVELDNLYLESTGITCDSKYYEMGIDPMNLTAQQKLYLTNFPTQFNPLFTQLLRDLNLNPSNLSICDKVYAMMQAEISEAVISSFFNSSN